MSEDSATSTRVLYIGVGNAGHNFARDALKLGEPRSSVIAFRRSPEDYVETDVEVYLPEIAGGELASYTGIHEGKRMTLGARVRLNEAVILVAGLGQSSGNILPELIRFVGAERIRRVEAILPFNFEGSRVKKAAKHQLKKIKAAGVEVWKRENERLIQNLPSDATMGEAFFYQSARIYKDTSKPSSRRSQYLPL